MLLILALAVMLCSTSAWAQQASVAEPQTLVSPAPVDAQNYPNIEIQAPAPPTATNAADDAGLQAATDESAESASADTQSADQTGQSAQAGNDDSGTVPATTSNSTGQNPPAVTPAQAPPNEQQTPPPQPKRILGIMPNFRAVSAGESGPPPTPKRAFTIATQNSFDYSSFIFVGFTSAFAEWSDSHKQLGEGMTGFGRYYWRGFVDKADGNYWVIFVLPTIFHQDERYHALGKGGVWKRFVYSVSRVVITPNYDGNETFNVSELLGRGIAQGVSLSYYPSQTRTLGGISSKYGYAIMRDALTNTFREFWPDIAVHVLHRHP